MTNAPNDLYKLPCHFGIAIDHLRRTQPAIYLVGGVIRNTLLGQKTTDLDVAVVGDGLQIGALTAKHLGGKYIELDRERRIARVILKGPETLQIDITSAVKGIEMDLDDRDFTINAMAVDIDHITEDLLFAKQSIIDPYNGYQDLSAGLIKAVSETSLVSDPVRMMRAIRFSANPQFKIENCTTINFK